ncbi:MAG: copper resistance protein CopC [Reyranella sp.]|nr:copper resistance protein CopC [Reyranella sp.]
MEFSIQRAVLVGLLAMMLPAAAWAQDVKVMDSAPKAQAVIGEPSSSFFVRFDRPIDHIHSSLSIWRGSQLVEDLQPRFQTEPNVLFSRAPTLPPGDYRLRWTVRTLEGVQVTQGDIPFTIKTPP